MTSVYSASYQKLLKAQYERFHNIELPDVCLIIDLYGKGDIRDYEVMVDPWEIQVFLEMQEDNN